MTRPRPHAAPAVRTGDSLAPGPSSDKPPSLLVPWLAVGAGLAALTALPDVSLGEPAGAEPIPVAASGFRSTEVAVFTTTLRETAVVAAPDASTPTASSSAVIDLTALADAQRTTIVNEYGGEGATTVAAAMPLWTNRTFASAPTQRPEPTDEQWAALRQCEASGDYTAVNFSGKYRGAYQFDLPTWESVGGVGDPAEATPEEQDLRAALLHQQRGSAPWPECGRYLD